MNFAIDGMQSTPSRAYDDTMALVLGQHLRQIQTLRLTMQLQQAIKLLQMNHQELVATVQKELMENPTLEEVAGTRTEGMTDSEMRLHDQIHANRADVVEQNNGATGDGPDWTGMNETPQSASQDRTEPNA